MEVSELSSTSRGGGGSSSLAVRSVRATGTSGLNTYIMNLLRYKKGDYVRREHHKKVKREWKR